MNRTEYGDFQTPSNLARDVCTLIARSGFSPASIIEPTCGRGAFLRAALDTFLNARHFVGIDRNPGYIEHARQALGRAMPRQKIMITTGDFFETDWTTIVNGLPTPILILGNPPWVTSATLGVIGSKNVPEKSNSSNLRGIDAMTGKSNFDISEWMLRKNLDWLVDKSGMLAVRCKTAVARKVLSYGWSSKLPIESACMHRIDAQMHFNASVDACLLCLQIQPGAATKDCSDYGSLNQSKAERVFGVRNGRLVADVYLYDRWHSLLGQGLSGWRSGIKHDCSRVFELVQRNGKLENGLGRQVDVEDETLFPLLKSSDLSKNQRPRKWLLVPQRSMSTPPERLRQRAPNAWKYLVDNQDLLSKRGSSIYRRRPPFSIFGVGDYSFARWKVAISGLYKRLDFARVSPVRERPVVLDDTCYFFPCRSAHECEILHRLVQSEPAQEFWSAFIFWDAKRPVTAETLNLLDFSALARAAGIRSELVRVLAERQLERYTAETHQELLFRDDGTGGSEHPRDFTHQGGPRAKKAAGATRTLE